MTYRPRIPAERLAEWLWDMPKMTEARVFVPHRGSEDWQATLVVGRYHDDFGGGWTTQARDGANNNLASLVVRPYPEEERLYQVAVMGESLVELGKCDSSREALVYALEIILDSGNWRRL